MRKTKLISDKKCLWDVSTAFLKMTSLARLNFLIKYKTLGTPPTQKIKTVNINGSESIYVLGKDNEYFCNGVSLTSTLLVCAKSTGNKIKIY